jgi:hypothetical protein
MPLTSPCGAGTWLIAEQPASAAHTQNNVQARRDRSMFIPPLAWNLSEESRKTGKQFAG